MEKQGKNMKYDLNEEHIIEGEKRTNLVGMTLIISFGLIIAITTIVLCLTSCTLSFTNVHTVGTATDVVDSDPHTDAKVDSKLSIPVKPL